MTAIATAVLAAAAGATLQSAYRQTALREAYLPDLERQAASNQSDSAFMALLGARLAQSGELPDAARAVDALRQSIADGSDDPQVYLTLAGAQAAMGDTGSSLQTLQAAEQSLPSSPAIEAAMARAQQVSGQPGAMANAIAPQRSRALIAEYAAGSFLNPLVEAWGRSHPSRSGFATRKDWARDEPSNAQAQRLWGLALLRNDRPQDAYPVLKKAEAMAPASAAVHLALGQVFESAGEPEPAIGEYAEAYRLNRRSLDAVMGIGRLSAQTGLAYTHGAYARAVQLGPRDADAWVGLGRTDVALQYNWPEAARAFDTAARLAPDREDFVSDRAEVLLRVGRDGEAQALLMRYLSSHPGDGHAQYEMAQALLQADPSPNGLKRAEAAARASLADTPGNYYTLLLLGSILVQEHRSHDALPMVTRIVAARPFDTSALSLLGEVYGQENKPTAAAAVQARVTRLTALQDAVAVLQAQASTRFLDPDYHKQLLALYLREHDMASAQKEQRILHGLSTQRSQIEQFVDEQRSIETLLGEGPLAVPSGVAGS